MTTAAAISGAALLLTLGFAAIDAALRYGDREYARQWDREHLPTPEETA